MRPANVLSARNVLCRWAVALALALLGLNAHAQLGGTDWSFERMMRTSTGGGSQSFTPGGAGTSVPGTWSRGAPDGRAGLPSTWTGHTRNAAGNRVAITATGRITNASMAATIGKYGRGLLGPVGAGMAIYALCQELGCFVTNDDGMPGVEVWEIDPASGWCTVGLCYHFRVSAHPNAQWKRTRREACDQYVTLQNEVTNSAFAFESVDTVNNLPGGRCVVTYTNTLGGRSQSIVSIATTQRPVDTGNPPLAPLTIEELEARIAAKSGWPSTSKIGDTLEEAQKKTGDLAKPQMDNITGPPKSEGKKSTRVSPNPDGSTRTETETCEFLHVYDSATMTITQEENCKTVVTNDGEQGKTTEKTETKTPDASDKGNQQKDQTCTDNPNSLECAEFDTPDGEIPKRTVALTYMAEVLGFGGGSCPSDVVRTVGGRSLTVFSYSSGCGWISNYVKPMVLALSAWIAFMILIPGGRAE